MVSFRETSLHCSISPRYASSALQREYSHFPGKENGFANTVVVCTKEERSREDSLDATWEAGKMRTVFWFSFFCSLFFRASSDIVCWGLNKELNF